MTATTNPAMLYECFKGWTTLEQAASHFGISRRGVQAYIDNHRETVKAVQINPRLHLVYLPSLEKARQTRTRRKAASAVHSTA